MLIFSIFWVWKFFIQWFKVIAFDADDTLWDNETYFREAEEQFVSLLENYLPPHSTLRALLRDDRQSPLYGYGIKAFVLSMIETAIQETNHHLPLTAIDEIIHLGKTMLSKPVTLIEDVEKVLGHPGEGINWWLLPKVIYWIGRKLKNQDWPATFTTSIMTEKAEDDYLKVDSTPPRYIQWPWQRWWW